MPAVEAFLTLEDSLRSRILGKWRKIALPMIIRMTNDVLAGDLSKMSAEVDKLNLQRICKGEQKFIRFHTIGSFLFGAANLTGDIKQTDAVKHSDVPEIIGPAQRSFRAMVLDLDRTMRGVATDTIELTHRMVRTWEDVKATDKQTRRRIVKQNIPAPFDIKEFQEFFGDEIIVASITAAKMKEFLEVFMEERISGAGDMVISAASSTHTSRLASYGFLSEAQLFDVKKYEISEQLDGRTCPVCQFMHGKKFDVDNTFERLDGILRIDEPAALKQAAPWPNQSKAGLTELRGMSNSQLQSRGVSFPPFHPNCRGVLMPIGGTSPGLI